MEVTLIGIWTAANAKIRHSSTFTA